MSTEKRNEDAKDDAGEEEVAAFYAAREAAETKTGHHWRDSLKSDSQHWQRETAFDFGRDPDHSRDEAGMFLAMRHISENYLSDMDSAVLRNFEWEKYASIGFWHNLFDLSEHAFKSKHCCFKSKSVDSRKEKIFAKKKSEFTAPDLKREAVLAVEEKKNPDKYKEFLNSQHDKLLERWYEKALRMTVWPEVAFERFHSKLCSCCHKQKDTEHNEKQKTIY